MATKKVNSTSTTTTPSIEDQIQKMEAAFNLAIDANNKITVAKTLKGSELTAAQQRPNI